MKCATKRESKSSPPRCVSPAVVVVEGQTWWRGGEWGGTSSRAALAGTFGIQVGPPPLPWELLPRGMQAAQRGSVCVGGSSGSSAGWHPPVALASGISAN